MKVVVLSRELPERWDKLAPVNLGGKDDTGKSFTGALRLKDYQGAPAYMVYVEIYSLEEAYLLQSQAADPNTPFFEMEECTIQQQIDQKRSGL